MTRRGNKGGNKFDFLAEVRQPQEEEAAPMAQAQKLESAQDNMSTSAHSTKRTSAQARQERKPSGQRIRADLLRAVKILSAETGTPQYLLIEEALEQYLAGRRTK